jgi:hypothetical protein
VDLATLSKQAVVGQYALATDQFVRLVVDTVCEGLPELSMPLHERQLKAIAEDIASTSMADTGVALDPFFVATGIIGALAECYAEGEPVYHLPVGTPHGQVEVDRFAARAAEVKVPTNFTSPLDRPGSVWQKKQHYRMPIRGWERSVHEAARFDTAPEYHMACRLDAMFGVTWMRNDPKQFAVETIARAARLYAPDFVVAVERAGDLRILLLEVKGEMLWSGPSSDAQVHARDLARWVSTANSIVGTERFESRVILGGDIDQVHDLADLVRLDRTPR